MTRIRCRHCGLPFELADGEAGAACPKCSRYTPRPTPPGPDLPPPQSALVVTDDPAEAARGNYFAACTLVIAVVFVMIGGYHLVVATVSDRPVADQLLAAGRSCASLLAARVFQAAAYAQWRR